MVIGLIVINLGPVRIADPQMVAMVPGDVLAVRVALHEVLPRADPLAGRAILLEIPLDRIRASLALILREVIANSPLRSAAGSTDKLNVILKKRQSLPLTSSSMSFLCVVWRAVVAVRGSRLSPQLRLQTKRNTIAGRVAC